MNTSLIAGYLPGITPEQLGEVSSPTSSVRSEWKSAMTSIAQRQHYAEDSLASAWMMIGTIFSCLAVMGAVVIATATSIA